MFFVLSKILHFLIQPLVWIIFLLVLGLLLKSPRWKKLNLRSCLILLLFFTNQPIYDRFMGWWEMETITADEIEQPFEVAILLGGFMDAELRQGEDRYNLGTSANRLMNTLELYFDGKIKRILITGGRSDIAQQKPKEALQAKALLVKMGIPAQDLIVESESRNTRENALYSKQLLPEGIDSTSILLATSAFHLRRSVACFKKVGLDCTPYATDFKTSQPKYDLKYWLVPDATTLSQWGYLVKEWVGYIVYKIVGYA